MEFTGIENSVSGAGNGQPASVVYNENIFADNRSATAVIG